MASSPYLRRAYLAVVLAVLSFGSALGWSASGAAAAPAEDFSARIQCDEDVLTIEFSWQPSEDGEQWLDLSLFDGSFAPGTFTGTGPLRAGRQSLEWTTALPGTDYFARINTFDGEGWEPSSTLMFTTPACGTPPPPSGPASNPDMQALQAALEQQIAAANFDAAVAVTDLQTGETISVNGDRPQLTGCVINLFALMQATIDVSNGLYDESRVGDLISATIYGSNPVTAHDILMISGDGDVVAAQQKINGLIQQIGLTTTFYDHPPAYWPSYAIRGISNLTTALEMNQALAAFWDGSIMPLEWRDYLYGKMQGVKPGLNYLIPAGVNGGTVGHKNGFLAFFGGWVDNDTGIVTFQSGGQTYAYAITFLTESVPVKYGDITLGQSVSSMVWQYFDSRY